MVRTTLRSWAALGVLLSGSAALVATSKGPIEFYLDESVSVDFELGAGESAAYLIQVDHVDSNGGGGVRVNTRTSVSAVQKLTAMTVTMVAASEDGVGDTGQEGRSTTQDVDADGLTITLDGDYDLGTSPTITLSVDEAGGTTGTLLVDVSVEIYGDLMGDTGAPLSVALVPLSD